MNLFHRPFVQVLLIIIAVLIFASVMAKYFPLPPEFFCMEYPDGAGCEKVRQSLPDLGPPDLFECILIAWMIVALLGLLLPRRYLVKLFKIAFPFLPDKLE